MTYLAKTPECVEVIPVTESHYAFGQYLLRERLFLHLQGGEEVVCEGALANLMMNVLVQAQRIIFTSASLLIIKF